MQSKIYTCTHRHFLDLNKMMEVKILDISKIKDGNGAVPMI